MASTQTEERISTVERPIHGSGIEVDEAFRAIITHSFPETEKPVEDRGLRHLEELLLESSDYATHLSHLITSAEHPILSSGELETSGLTHLYLPDLPKGSKEYDDEMRYLDEARRGIASYGGVRVKNEAGQDYPDPDDKYAKEIPTPHHAVVDVADIRTYAQKRLVAHLEGKSPEDAEGIIAKKMAMIVAELVERTNRPLIVTISAEEVLDGCVFDRSDFTTALEARLAITCRHGDIVFPRGEIQVLVRDERKIIDELIAGHRLGAQILTEQGLRPEEWGCIFMTESGVTIKHDFDNFEPQNVRYRARKSEWLEQPYRAVLRDYLLGNRPQLIFDAIVRKNIDRLSGYADFDLDDFAGTVGDPAFQTLFEAEDRKIIEELAALQVVRDTKYVHDVDLYNTCAADVAVSQFSSGRTVRFEARDYELPSAENNYVEWSALTVMKRAIVAYNQSHPDQAPCVLEIARIQTQDVVYRSDAVD